MEFWTTLKILLATMPMLKAFMFTSSERNMKLLRTEGEVINVISRYIISEEKRLLHLKEIFKDLKKNHDVDVEGGVEIFKNPLNYLMLIKRLTSDWKNLKSIATDQENAQMLLNFTNERHDLTFPDDRELTSNMHSLLQLQRVYELKSRDIAQGNFFQLKSSYKFKAEDCFEIGKIAKKDNQIHVAIEWMELAVEISKKEENSNINELDALIYITESYYLENEIKKALESVNRLLHLDPGNAKGQLQKAQLDKIISNENITNTTNFESKIWLNRLNVYNRLCQGKTLTPLKKLAKLRCRLYQCRNPYCIISRFKVEELHRNPEVLRYYDVITDREIAIMKQKASPLLKVALVQNEDGTIDLSYNRISKTCAIGINNHKFALKIAQRVSMMTELNLDSAEDFQIANYGIGGFFNLHYDYSVLVKEGTINNPKNRNRIATALLYISDVEKGGYTVFTELLVGTKPIKGSAVFWWNLKKSGKPDLLTMHAGCPVIFGDKWICNLWFHENGQEFRRPCSLSPDE